MLCILLAACSDSLFDGDGGKLTGEDRIQLSGSIEQLSLTRVGDNCFCDGDVMGVYVVDYNGGTPGTLKPSGHRCDNVRQPTTSGNPPTTYTGKTSTLTSTFTATIPSPTPRASTTISLRCRKTRAALPSTARWAATRQTRRSTKPTSPYAVIGKNFPS